MSYNALELVCWNIRGLNSPAKRKALREFVASIRTAIICILETKLEVVDQFVIMQCMGPAYYIFLPSFFGDSWRDFCCLGFYQSAVDKLCQ